MDKNMNQIEKEMSKAVEDVLAGKGQTTYSDKSAKLMDFEELKKICYKLKVEEPERKPKKKKLFERIMNKFGWYRKRELYVIREQDLIKFYFGKPISFM